MIDYFALFEEARRPWLDPEELKKKYFARSRISPPSAEVNEAFRVLSDPKLRLQHLLMLEGADLNAGRPVPASVAELFWNTGTLLREIEAWQLRKEGATTALSLALLQPERAKLKGRLDELEERLRTTYDLALDELPRGEVDWPNELRATIARYDAIAYLTRLLERTAEKRFHLTID